MSRVNPRRESKGAAFLKSLTKLDRAERGGDSWFVSVCIASVTFAVLYVVVEEKAESLFDIFVQASYLAALGAGTVILVRNLIVQRFFRRPEMPDDTDDG